MKKKILLILLGVALVAFIITLIKGSHSEYGTKAEVQVPKTVEATKVKDVTFIIDNSGSMRGYVDFSGNKPEFQRATKALLSTTGDFMSNCSKNLRASTKALCNGQEYDIEGTRTSLSNYSAFSGPITEVADLIKKGAAMASGDTSVCVIVSDMVLSYGKNTLNEKNDKYYNLHSLAELQTKVRDVFKDLRLNNKEVMIVKYEGHFNGKYYYNYTENLDPCNFKDSLMENRPFYYTIIGSSEALKSLCDNKCIPKPSQIFTSLTLTDSDLKIETYQVNQDPNQVQWILGNPNPTEAADRIYSVTMMKDLKTNTSEFTFSFDKFEIPIYVNDTMITAEPYDKHLQKVSSLNGNSSFSVTTCPFNQLSREQTVNVDFTSPRYVDFKSSSIDDDTNCTVKELEHKTWGLKAVVAALYDAYDIKDGDKNKILSLQFRILTGN